MKQLIYILFLLLIPNIYIYSQLKGSGTKEDPYQITTIREVQDNLHGLNLYYILMNDIDASETRNWNIGDHDGDSTTPDVPKGFIPRDFFDNTLDGNGFVIRNLYINRPLGFNVGLFDWVSGSHIFHLGIENCDITGGYGVGAMCGLAEGGGFIYGCYTSGNIYSYENSTYIGGFCGISSINSIRDCYSECNIYTKSKYDSLVTGFCFKVASLSFTENCYTTGKIESINKATTFGQGRGAKVKKCYWDIETTGIPVDSGDYGAYGKTTAEMKKRSTYSGWDFDSVWCIDEGKDYPKLRAFGKCGGTSVAQPPQPEPEFSISPNPASDFINITVGTRHAVSLHPSTDRRVNPTVDGTFGIRIYDIYGELVMAVGQTPPSDRTNPTLAKGNLTPALSTGEGVRIDVSGLAPGVYFVQAGGYKGKFVKIWQ